MVKNLNFNIALFGFLFSFIMFFGFATPVSAADFKPPNLENSDQLKQLKQDNPAHIVYYNIEKGKFYFMGDDKFTAKGDIYRVAGYDYSSIDNGKTWKKSQSPLSDVTINHPNVVVVQASETLFLTNGEEFFYIHPLQNALTDFSDKVVLTSKNLITVGLLILSLMLSVPLLKKLWMFF